LITKIIQIKSQRELAGIFGPYDSNIKKMNEMFGVGMSVGENRLVLRWKPSGLDGARLALLLKQR